MDDNSKQFFDWLRKIRFKDKLAEAIGNESIRGFASRCGLSDTVLRNYMNEKTYPSLDRLAMIAEAAQKPIGWFLSAEDDANSFIHSANKYSQTTEVYQQNLEQIETQLRAIFDLMSFEEKEKAIMIFKISGLKGLMPMVLADDEVMSKEIFEQRNSVEKDSSASNVRTQNKAG
ncbi:helix-turn-helix domain-containing protein [Citrobacter freundii]|uniref:helix-turn-helix domain-containing protein n=1 Tax=Citrobacter freundii TaxID=546 RepID=UPI00070C3A66|nr:helix-turn-helix transcriptional regulator [Citrobacter freundii]